MNNYLLFSMILVLSLFISFSLSLQIHEYYFMNRIDHFDPSYNNSYPQRVWNCSDYFDTNNGTLLLYLNGEYVGYFPAENSFTLTLAKKFKSYIISAEHRYYGKSQPMPDWSLPNLQYLTHDQALADFAMIIASSQKNLSQMYGISTKLKVIVVGGSYPGALSAWMRLKYPHLVDASLASSGVINAIEDFNMFDGVELIATQKEGNDCRDNIRWYLDDAKERFNGNPADSFNFRMLYNAPYLEWDSYMYYIADIFGESIQYGYRTLLCQFLRNESQMNVSPIQKHIDLYNFGMNHRTSPPSYSFHYIRQPEIDFKLSTRQWKYQFCTSLAYFNTPFSKNLNLRYSEMNLTYWKNYCFKSFGTDVYPDTNHTNAIYGDVRIGTSISHIYYTNGLDDPWQGASITSLSDKLNNSKATLINCDNCGHCIDLHAPSNNDKQILIDTRNDIIQTLGKWIGLIPNS